MNHFQDKLGTRRFDIVFIYTYKYIIYFKLIDQNEIVF